jgi:hypothetical protein
MRIEILDAAGGVINTIISSAAVAEQLYPGRWSEAARQDEPAQVSPPEWQWYIDVGPFFDRFGEAAMPVLMSDNAIVKAMLENLRARKWIDLQRPDVAQGVQLIGSVIPAVTPEIQASIINTPVRDDENMALRKLFFS